MIELFYYPTPNGRKISILLEELELKYRIIRIDITKNEQFSENFLKISPLNKIPAIIYDQETVFESGAILIYLAKKNNFKFYPQKYEKNINEWLMVQVSFVGPMLGQLHYFYKFNKNYELIKDSGSYMIRHDKTKKILVSDGDKIKLDNYNGEIRKNNTWDIYNDMNKKDKSIIINRDKRKCLSNNGRYIKLDTCSNINEQKFRVNKRLIKKNINKNINKMK